MTKFVDLPIEGPLPGAWAKEFGADLLPIQARAVEAGLLNRRNLIVCAPTAAGKTIVGEMAAAMSANQGRRALFLVPLKALAEEKYRDFRARYETFGFRIVASTRDRSGCDGDLVQGKYEIAIATVEKMAALVAAHPTILHGVGLVVADELHLLADPSRAQPLELLLAAAMAAEPPPQMLGLSPVLENATEVAAWLRAECIVETKRPVELRKGVMRDGTFRYVEHNTRREGEETILGYDVEPGPDRVMELLRRALEQLSVKKKEASLVFVPSKRMCEELAAQVASQVALPAAHEAIAELRRLPDSALRDRQCRALESGVAFHNGDLPLAMRSVIERHAAGGAIRIVIATPTLGMGVHLPFVNVFIVPEKWNGEAFVPLTRMEYENWSGRGGRTGYGREFGRAIVVVHGEQQERAFLSCYVRAPFDSVQPALIDVPPEELVLRAQAMSRAATPAELAAFLKSTFTGRMVWSREEGFASRLESALHLLREAGMIEADGVGLTKLGGVAARAGVRVATAVTFSQWCDAHRDLKTEPLEVLLTINTAADAVREKVPLSRVERRLDHYPKLLRGAASSRLLSALLPIANPSRPLEDATLMSVKKALVVHAWIEGRPLRELEERFGLGGGVVEALVEETAWLVDTLGRVATERGWEHDRVASEIESVLAKLRSTEAPPAPVAVASRDVPVLEFAPDKTGRKFGSLLVCGVPRVLAAARFKLLLHLSMAVHAGQDWVMDVEAGKRRDNFRQTVHYVRTKLTEWAGDPSRQLIENDGNRSYRLMLKRKEIVLDRRGLEGQYAGYLAQIKKALGLGTKEAQRKV